MTLPLTSTCVGGRRAGLPPVMAFSKPAAEPIEAPRTFTARQLQVIATVIRTGTCIGASAELGLHVRVVEKHLRNARAVVGVETNYQLIAAYAAGNGRAGGFE